MHDESGSNRIRNHLSRSVTGPGTRSDPFDIKKTVKFLEQFEQLFTVFIVVDYMDPAFVGMSMCHPTRANFFTWSSFRQC